MIYLLDTNACINYIVGISSHLKMRFVSTPPERIAICSVVETELYYGAFKSANPPKNLALYKAFIAGLKHNYPFDSAAALIAAEIRAHLAKAGTPIGPYDLQIAAIAIANNATLVTHNTREFQRVPGLLIDDWEVSV
jgi:tRNA(fMet)-specific endonuclease VapC